MTSHTSSSTAYPRPANLAGALLVLALCTGCTTPFEPPQIFTMPTRLHRPVPMASARMPTQRPTPSAQNRSFRRPKTPGRMLRLRVSAKFQRTRRLPA